jgi:MFS family permease
MFIRAWRFITLMLTSLSLSLSMAQLLELLQRMQFDQQLWVRVTILENVYKLFVSVGAVFGITAILTTLVMAFLVRRRGSTFYWALGRAIFLVLAVVIWIMFIAPMNAEFAQWLTNPVPTDWTRYSDQWEYAHEVNALIKMIGLILLVVSVLVETPKKRAIHSD